MTHKSEYFCELCAGSGNAQPIKHQKLMLPGLDQGHVKKAETAAIQILNEETQLKSVAVNIPNITEETNLKETIESHVALSQPPDKSNKISTDSNHACNCGNKLSEIREREIKIQKREEELNIKEKKATEKSRENLKLESYIKKLEARKEELSNTNKTLTTRIEMLESSTTKPDDRGIHAAPTNVTPQPYRSQYFEEKLHRLHDRITDIVFAKVENEIDKLASD